MIGFFEWNSRQKNERLAVGLFVAGAVIVVVLVVVVAKSLGKQQWLARGGAKVLGYARARWTCANLVEVQRPILFATPQLLRKIQRYGSNFP